MTTTATNAVRCRARIVREFKKRKADSLHPVLGDGEPNPHATKYPECGGNVTAAIRIEAVLGWGETTYELELSAECSRCRWPWTPRLVELRERAVQVRIRPREGFDVTEMLEVE